MEKDIKKIVNYAKCFDKKEKISILHFLLSENKNTVENISKVLNIKSSTVYKYLKQMIKAGIINQRKLPGKKGKLQFDINEVSFTINQKVIKNIFGLENTGKKLIIFDVDDTLIRRTDIVEELSFAAKNAIKEAKRIFQTQGIPISMAPKELFKPDWIHSKYGNSIEWYMGTLLGVAGVPECKIKEDLIRKYVKEYYNNIESSSTNCKLFEDVKPFLEKMKSETYFAAMSNSSKKSIIKMLEVNDILTYFNKEGNLLILGGDEIVKSKEVVQQLIRMTDIDIKNVLLIGDTGADIKVAVEAGIHPNKVFAITRGITPLEILKLIKPKVKIINSLLEIKYI